MDKDYYKKYREEHKEKHSVYAKQWYEKNKEKHLKRARAYQAKNKDKVKAQRKKYRENHKEEISIKHKIIDRTDKRRFSNANKNARTRNIEFSISFEQFVEIINKPCYYCNFLLGERVEVGSGLDRLDNSKGYTIENIVSSCKTCNLIKHYKLSPEETKVAVEAIILYRSKK